MKQFALIAFVLVAIVSSCATPRAKEHALAPAVVAAWDGEFGIEADVELGIFDAETSGDITSLEAMNLRANASELDRALASKDMQALTIFNWNELEPYARRGVQALVSQGELGPGGAVSLFERIDNFTEAFTKL